MGIALAEGLKLGRQMAAATRKKESVSLSIFMEVNSVEDELSTMVSDWEDGEESSRRLGARRYLQYMQEQSCARLGILTSSSHSGTPGCLRNRWRWT